MSNHKWYTTSLLPPCSHWSSHLWGGGSLHWQKTSPCLWSVGWSSCLFPAWKLSKYVLWVPHRYVTWQSYDWINSHMTLHIYAIHHVYFYSLAIATDSNNYSRQLISWLWHLLHKQSHDHCVYHMTQNSLKDWPVWRRLDSAVTWVSVRWLISDQRTLGLRWSEWRHSVCPLARYVCVCVCVCVRVCVCVYKPTCTCLCSSILMSLYICTYFFLRASTV